MVARKVSPTPQTPEMILESLNQAVNVIPGLGITRAEAADERDDGEEDQQPLLIYSSISEEAAEDQMLQLQEHNTALQTENSKLKHLLTDAQQLIIKLLNERQHWKATMAKRASSRSEKDDAMPTTLSPMTTSNNST